MVDESETAEGQKMDIGTAAVVLGLGVGAVAWEWRQLRRERMHYESLEKKLSDRVDKG